MNNVYIIAEAGVNHNGSLDKALALVDIAFNAGADCIKFQAYTADELVTKNAPKAEYQKGGSEETQYDMLLKYELSFDNFKVISSYCKYRNIDFLVTPFSLRWVKVFKSMEIKGFKISSGSVTSKDLLKEIGMTRLPVILSTGMSNLEDIEKAVEILRINGCKDLSILHCVSLYPTPIEKVNLFSMHVLKEIFKVPVGFSDHTIGTRVAPLAIAAGATILEKHFTINKTLDGPDHKISLNPHELKIYIKKSRKACIICGNKEKKILEEEMDIKRMVQGSLVAKKFIKEGQIIFKHMLIEKRPSTGISPMEAHNIIGKIATRDIKADEILTYEHFMEG